MNRMPASVRAICAPKDENEGAVELKMSQILEQEKGLHRYT
jgi:hypothetical protein